MLWLVATAQVTPLAWEPPHAEGAALEKAKRQEKEKEKKEVVLFLPRHPITTQSWVSFSLPSWGGLFLGAPRTPFLE